jgi:hypothetical protein
MIFGQHWLKPLLLIPINKNQTRINLKPEQGALLFKDIEPKLLQRQHNKHERMKVKNNWQFL